MIAKAIYFQMPILKSSRRTHILRKSFVAGSEAVVTYGDVQTFRLQDEVYDPKRKLKDMDEAGVDMALLSTNIPPPCMLAPELGNKGAQAINDAIAELVDAHPHRFAGLACLPWQNPNEAITEMDRVKGLGFRGIMLYSHIGGKPVDAPHFEPVYTHAETLRMPIVMHPTVPTWGEAIKDHWMIGMMGLQVDNSFALLRLILSGILERHPQPPNCDAARRWHSTLYERQDRSPDRSLRESEREHHTTAERVSATHLSGHRLAIGASTAVRISVFRCRSLAVRDRSSVGGYATIRPFN